MLSEEIKPPGIVMAFKNNKNTWEAQKKPPNKPNKKTTWKKTPKTHQKREECLHYQILGGLNVFINFSHT